MSIQTIKPKTGTSRGSQPQQQVNETEPVVDAVTRAPPPPGMGKFIDKVA
jgi:hypothetical protein